MYLTRTAIAAILETIAGLAPGTELIVDFMLPAECRDEAGEFYASQVAPNAAAGGEPWLSFFTPAEIGELLRPLGFSEPTTSTQRAAIDDGLWRRQDALRPAELSVLTHAVVGRPVTPSDQIGPADSSG
jgi:O-methyltransferase involved in polyketide biosynthesis